MQWSRESAATSPGRRPWAAAVLCLLFAFGTILHVAHAAPVQADASAPQVMAVSDGADLCEPGHATGEHCQPTNGCPLCAPIATAETFYDPARARLPIAAATPMPGGVITRPFHPPKPSLQA